MSLKLLIIGHARHGKDTVCEILAENYFFDFESSSRFCSKRFIFNELKDKYGYKTEEECYNDRHNHREEWFNLIQDYNKDDYSRLGREIFNNYSIYCGLRNKKEFEALKKSDIPFITIWVDRSLHLPPEPKESMSLDMSMADFILDNNGDLNDLEENILTTLGKIIKSLEEIKTEKAGI